MNDEILNSNKIPGSPGCDSFTRPEEISALSKFLGTKRKIMEENTQLDSSLEPVPGITTGKFPIIDKLPDTAENIDLSREEVSLSDKLISLDKNSSNFGKEINNLPDNYIGLDNENYNISLSDKILKIALENDINLEEKVDKLKVSDDIELSKDKLDLNITDDIELSDNKLDLNVINDIELSSNKLDLNVINDIELNEDKLSLDITDDIELSSNKLSLDITDDIELSSNKLGLDTTDDIELSDNKLSLDITDDIELSSNKLGLDVTDDIELNEDKLGLNITDDIELSDNKLSLDVTNDIELNEDKLGLNITDDIELSDNKLNLNVIDDIELSENKLGLNIIDNIELDEDKLSLDITNDIELSKNKLDLDITDDIELSENKLSLSIADDIELSDNKLNLNITDDIELSDNIIDLSILDNIELSDSILELDYSNEINLSNKKINIEHKDKSNLSEERLSLLIDSNIDLDNFLDSLFIGNDSEIDSLSDTRLDINKTDKVISLETIIDEISDAISPENQTDYFYGEKPSEVFYELINLENKANLLSGETHDWFNNIGSDNKSSKINSSNSTNYASSAEGVSNNTELENFNKTRAIQDDSFNLPISANVDITIDGRTTQDREYINNSDRLSNSTVNNYDNLLEFNKNRSKTLGVEDNKNAFNLPNSKEVDNPEETNEYSYNALNNILHLKFGSDGETRLDKVGKYDKNGNPIGNNTADDYDNLLEFNKDRSKNAFERPIARDTKVSQNDKYIPLENLKPLHEKDQNKNYKKSEYIKKIKDSLPTASEDEIFNMIMDFDEYIWSPITESDGDSNKIGGTKSKGYESGLEINTYEQKNKKDVESISVGKHEWIAKIKALTCAYLGVSDKLSEKDKKDLNEKNADDYIESVNDTMRMVFSLNNNQPEAKEVETPENNKYSYDTLNNILHLKFGSDGKTRLDNNKNSIADDYDNLLDFNKSRSKTLGGEDNKNAFNLPNSKEVDNPEETSEYSYFNNTIGTSTIGEISDFNNTIANAFELPQDYDKSLNNSSPIEDSTDEDNIYIKNKGNFKSKDFDSLTKSNDRGYNDEIPYYKLPDQSFALDKNYTIGNYLRFAAEEIFGSWSRDLKMKKARKVLLEETLALLIWGRDELEKLTKANKYRLPGDDFGLLSDLVSGGSTKDLAKNALNSVSDALSKETPNPINRPVWDKDKNSTKTIGWEEANSRPSVVTTTTEKEDESFWKKLGNNLVGSIGNDPNNNRKYKFVEQYLTAGKGIKTTLFDFTGLGKLPEDKGTVESFYDLLKTSPYFTTSNKITTTGSGYKVITLDSNMHWEIIFEPYIGELNGNYTFLPPINEINLRNKDLHGVTTSYNYWIPINSFELQKEKLNTKSLGLFDGEIVYPISMDFINEFRMTIVDDQYKSWRNYFERCVQASVYNSTPVGKTGTYKVDSSLDLNLSFLSRNYTSRNYVTESKDSSIVIDRNFHLVAPYKNLTFRCRIYVMTPQLSTINKYDLLLVLKDFSEERSGEIDSSGSDLNLSFSIVGENPTYATETEELGRKVARQVNTNEQQIEEHRNAMKEENNWAANLTAGITNTVLEILE